MGRILLPILVLTAAVTLAACTTSNTIDGHQIRGTATPETPVEQAAREFWEDVGRDVADAYGDDPQVQAAIKARQAERRVTEDSRDLHRHAPAWMRERWAEYLELAAGSYAVLALDRNGNGVGVTYCRGSKCGGPMTSTGRSWRDVHYKHGALDNCRESVRNFAPAERPDCAIYAVKDKIVWKGRMPWE